MTSRNFRTVHLSHLKIENADIYLKLKFKYDIRRILFWIYFAVIFLYFLLSRIFRGYSINIWWIFLFLGITTIPWWVSSNIIFSITNSEPFKFYGLKVRAYLLSYIGKGSLFRLIKDAENYNKNVSNFLITCDILRDKNYHDSDTAKSIANDLKKTKENIINAIRVESILRTEPDYNPHQYYSLFDFSETTNINNAASEYGSIFNENAKISMNVEKEYERLMRNTMNY